MNINDFTINEDENEDYTATFMSVGATEDKTVALNKIIFDSFDDLPEIEKSSERNNVIYTYKGRAGGIDHVVSIECVGSPCPPTMTRIHYAKTKVPTGKGDRITVTIMEEFLRYEKETKEQTSSGL